MARRAIRPARVLVHRPDDDRGWATLALCQTMLGNYKFAVSAYHRALASAPKIPGTAHNLGHLLDVALGRAAEAIGWLKRAYQSATDSGEVAASYAHALARLGRLAEARKVPTRAMKRGASRELSALLKWLEQGAPPEKDHPLPRPAPIHALSVRSVENSTLSREADGESRLGVKRDDAALPHGAPSGLRRSRISRMSWRAASRACRSTRNSGLGRRRLPGMPSSISRDRPGSAEPLRLRAVPSTRSPRPSRTPSCTSTTCP